MTHSPKQHVKVTREELYELVWASPMIKVALQYSISGNGLKKVCKRLEVPYPSRGYWAKKAAGKPTVRFKLPEKRPDSPHFAVVSPIPKPSLVLLATKTREAQANNGVPTIVVTERLIDPHPIIAKRIKDHNEKRKKYLAASDNGRNNHWGFPSYVATVPALSQLDRREHRILDALFKAVEKSGGHVRAVDTEEAEFEFNGTSINFRISHKPLTKSRASKSTAPPVGAQGKKSASTEQMGLAFTITTDVERGARRQWRDTKRSTLECHVQEVFQTLVAAVPILAERDRKWREERKRDEARWRIWEERERKRKLEERRWNRIQKTADELDRLDKVRKLLTALEQQAETADAAVQSIEVSKWIEWIRDQLRQRDPLSIGLAALFQELEAVTE